MLFSDLLCRFLPDLSALFLDGLKVQMINHVRPAGRCVAKRCCFCCVAGQRSVEQKPSYWWILGVVAAGLVLVLAGLLAFLKLKGETAN